MKRYTAAFDYLNRSPKSYDPTELLKASSAFEDIGSSIDHALDTLGVLMFWAASGSGNGDDKIASNEATDSIASIGELLQLLMELKEFALKNEVTIDGFRNESQALKTAIKRAA